jgi:hypothetical protein
MSYVTDTPQEHRLDTISSWGMPREGMWRAPGSDRTARPRFRCVSLTPTR